VYPKDTKSLLSASRGALVLDDQLRCCKAPPACAGMTVKWESERQPRPPDR
jgi:hypothetical protein